VVEGAVAAYRIGAGPPVAFLLGLAPSRGVPRGWQRARQSRFLRPLARRCSVHVMTFAPAEGATMADLAADGAAAMRALGTPIDVIGLSTGGAIALQLALDHPALVRRLVLVATGPRLSPVGARASARCAALIEAGRPRAGLKALALMMPRAVTRIVMGWTFWLGAAAVSLGKDWDPRLVARALRAELAFDATARLAKLRVPTLLIAGDRDPCYAIVDARDAAARIPDARLIEIHAGHFGVIAHRRLWSEVIAFLA
jgi:pimeloyl-ACP methyl ester carboxylesterase